MKNNKLTNHTKPFIPTMAEWAMFFAAWHKRLEASLRKSGSMAACEEAVQEAFIKVLGLSDHLHLAKPLMPKTEDQWYAFLYYQAKARLSCYNQQGKRFVQLTEWWNDEEALDEDGWGVAEDSSEPAATMPMTRDRTWVRDEFRKVFADLCRSAGVKDCNHRAFVRFILDEKSGSDVVAEIPEILNANNLYQVKKRIMNLLMASADRFAGIHNELMAA